MQDFKRLVVWQKAHRLTIRVYQLTRRFPKEELYGLTSQIRRCASSVGANIAEGCGRGGNAELAHFLRIAAGSASELEYHSLLSRDLGFMNDKEYGEISESVDEVKRMLSSLMKRVREGASDRPPRANSSSRKDELKTDN